MPWEFEFLFSGSLTSTNPSPFAQHATDSKEGTCEATYEMEFKLPWREAGSLDHHDDNWTRRSMLPMNHSHSAKGSDMMAVKVNPRRF